MNRTEITDTLVGSWASLDAVAGAMTPEQWATQSLCPEWDMRGVMLHAAMIEKALIGWPPGGDGLFPRFAEAYKSLADLDAPALLVEFRSIVAARTEALRAMTDSDFETSGQTPIGPGTYGRFMTIRTFDNWVHERDMRVPLGLTGNDGGVAGELSLDEVHNSLGFIAGKKIGLPDGKSLAFRLTGPVSRDMFVAVDGRAKVVPTLADPDATLTTDSLTFMLLACGRIDPEEPIADGRITWTGDDALGGLAARNLRFTI